MVTRKYNNYEKGYTHRLAISEKTKERDGRRQDKEGIMGRLRSLGYM